MQVIVPNIKFH